MKNFKQYFVAFTLAFLLTIPTLAHAGDATDLEPRLKHAIKVIKNTYGDDVLITNKAKSLLKFGRATVGTSAMTVMTLPGSELNETYVTTNIIDKISSSSTNDATEVIQYEGHTCSGGVPTTFVSDTVTLQGQTETDLPTDVCRVTRAFNTSATAIDGNIYFYQDDTVSSGVPQTDAKVHMIIPAGKQQSVKAATALSSTDYAICTQVYGSVIEKQASWADFELQVRLPGSVFREQFQFAASDSSGGKILELDPAIVIPASADVRLVTKADNASTVVSGGFNCYLAVVR